MKTQVYKYNPLSITELKDKIIEIELQSCQTLLETSGIARSGNLSDFVFRI